MRDPRCEVTAPRQRRRGFGRGVILVAGVAGAGCLIQRPAVPREFLDLRYEVIDSAAAVAGDVLREDTVARELVRGRLPSFARRTHVDTLVTQMAEDPILWPLGLRLRGVLSDAVGRASGRVRGALSHPDAQRQLVDAVVLALARALREWEEARGPPEPR